jgi:cyclophilin family peptidyl-prolyl cis-trans isomerase
MCSAPHYFCVRGNAAFFRAQLFGMGRAVLILALTVLTSASNVTQSATPDHFVVSFETDVKCGADVCEPIIMNITREWAPLGVRQFYELNTANYFEGNAFFRVVPNFVNQFGIGPNWRGWSTPIQDDPVVTSNVEGTIVYASAGPNSRTTQLFINMKDNAQLDDLGFAPFGVVVSGMETAKKIFNPTPGATDGVNQLEYKDKGNDWIRQAYPGINFITKATILPSTPTPAPAPTPSPPPTPPDPTPAPSTCDVSPAERTVCGGGRPIINEQDCLRNKECCWSREPITAIWCYNHES